MSRTQTDRDLTKADVAECNEGDPLACLRAGTAFERGIGVAVDYQMAARAYRKACKARNGYGCWFLGALHYNGHLETDDPNAVATLLDRACDYGAGEVCFMLSEMHDEPELAAEYRQRGCDAGFVDACSESPRPPPATQPQPSPNELETMCSDGVGEACSRIGFLVLVETEAPPGEQDADRYYGLRKAQPHFRKACDLGHTEGCRFVMRAKGFYCTEPSPPNEAIVDTLETGQCSRAPATCDLDREFLRETGWTAPACTARERAACYSYSVVLDRRRVRSCFATFDECEAWQSSTAERASESRDIAKVSGCKATE